MGGKTLRSKFSKKVKVLRKKRGWTQKELARRARISKGYLQKIEGKNPPDVTIDIIKKISDAFKQQISDLFC